MSDNAFGLNILTNLNDDKGFINLETIQSLEPGDYKLENFYPKDCGEKSAINIQTSEVGINFKGGDGSVGKDGCLVDGNSYLRTNTLTNLNTINQLNERLTLTNPYIRGFYNVDKETYLISSDGTKQQRPCNVLSGISLLDYQYTPQVPKLKKNVQDPIHIIPEDNEDTWKRGGVSTRQIMRNMDYFNRCQKK